MTRQPPPARHARRQVNGFTLVEIAIVLALVGFLSGLSITSYMGYVEKARVVRAVAEIEGMSRILDGMADDEHDTLPDTLAETELGAPLDPWGNPYRYLRIVAPPGPGGGGPGGGGGAPNIGQARKDAFLVPINSDYDLYSTGPDGESKPSLQPPASRDDVIRANDGGYVGLASRY